MKNRERFIVAVAVWFFCSDPVHAGLSNCTDIYVGAIGYQYNAAPVVVFLESPTDVSGSYAISLTDFSAEERKNIIAILLSAKLSGHRVAVTTAAVNQCGISSTWQNLRSVTLNNNP